MIRTLHRLLRLLLPSDFRGRWGADMEEAFVEAWAAGTGVQAVLRLLWREAVDQARTGRRLRAWQGRRDRWVERTSGRTGGGVMRIRDDLGYAVRSLVRRPSTTIFAAVTVALGVGSTTAIYSALEGVLLNPIPYDSADRMVSVFQRAGEPGAQVWLTPSEQQIAAIADQTDMVEGIEPWMMTYRTLTGLGDVRTVDVGLVRPTVHDLIGRAPILGRTFSEEELRGDGAHVLMLGHGLWSRAFGGDRDVLGETITLDGEPWTIIGVMPPKTVLVGWGAVTADVWAPLPDSRVANPTSVIAILQPGVDVETFNERLAQVARGTEPGQESWVAEGRAVREVIGGSFGDTLKVLMAAVVLLLLVACVNVSNLLLSSADSRKRETAVRAALGASGRRLMSQFLLESVLIASLGGAAGVGLAYLGQETIISLRPDRLAALDTVTMNVRVLLFALGITVATGILFGLFPAYQASRPGALEPLRTGTRSGGDRASGRFRWSLVSGEVALSFALLLGATLVLSSLARLSRADIGFPADEVLVLGIALPSWTYEAEEASAAFDGLAERLRGVPGVVHVARTNGVPGAAGITFGQFHAEGAEPSTETLILHGPDIDADYFATLGQPTLAGRGFTADEVRSGADIWILGEQAARRFFGGVEEAVGATLIVGDDNPQTVVGVVADVPMTGLSSRAAQLQAYGPLRSSRAGMLVIRVGTGYSARSLVPQVRTAALEIDDDVRVDRLTVASDLLQDSLARERFTLSIIASFAAMALLLAGVGLYGVLSHAVGRRVREIGIRIALGAGRGSVRSLVLRRAGAATVVGIVAGVGLAVAGIRLLQSQLFGLDESGPGSFVAAALVLGAVSMVAAYVPARRATRVDPVRAMQAE